MFVMTSHLVGSSAIASPIYGLVQTINQRLYLRQNEDLYLIQAGSEDVANDLVRLSGGDFISFEGYFNPSKKAVRVQSIDWVGLKKLIGYWRSRENISLEFRDFTRLIVYDANVNDVFVRLYNKNLTRTTSLLNYRIAPGVGNTWSLFLSDEKIVKVGRLTVNGDTATINFFDSNTGKVIKTVLLQKQR